MGVHDSDVLGVIGREAWDLILDNVRKGAIKPKKIVDIARHLGNEVGGGHAARIEKGHDCDDSEMREVLSDWYQRELFQQKGKGDEGKKIAMEKLTWIFEDKDVGLQFLAYDLQKLLPTSHPDILTEGVSSIVSFYFFFNL